jgi:beta-lactam-binding protein with PASTA domain
VIFFIAVRGGEQTMVPDVQGKELTEALLELQLKELYPRIQLRYSQTAFDRGRILEQEPRPGSIVKAGRRIRLVVSQGVIISKVENYIGRDLNDVRMDIQTMAAGTAIPLLSLKEPFMYVFSQMEPGTILEQRPEPETNISGPLQLEFVVSKGSEDAVITVPQFIGLSIPAALERISASNNNFSFSLRPAQGQERSETVVSQEPVANSTVNINTIVHLAVTPPQNLADNEVFTLFRYTIPLNPYPLATRLEVLHPSGDRVRIISVEYAGGDFIVPCRVPAGSILILSILNREIHRETVSYRVETLSLDQL